MTRTLLFACAFVLSLCLCLCNCKKSRSTITPAPTPTPTNNSCDFTDTATDNKLPLSAYCNGKEFIAESATSFSDSTGTVPMRVISATSSTFGPGGTDIELYIENYSGPKTYQITSNHTFGTYKDLDTLGTCTSGMACDQAGSITITYDNNDTIKGTFHFMCKTLNQKTSIRVAGGYFSVYKQP